MGTTWVEVAQRAGGRGVGDAESGWRVRTSDACVRAFQKYFSNINFQSPLDVLSKTFSTFGNEYLKLYGD